MISNSLTFFYGKGEQSRLFPRMIAGKQAVHPLYLAVHGSGFRVPRTGNMMQTNSFQTLAFFLLVALTAVVGALAGQ